ncbi:hypothetical protein LAZ67_3001238 [Cordylochernes scorpioides]|uniref:Transposase n=1 Tax=Cordylochernes scorpioides TaxID=51811 RepID=A0ABY6K732_9ARAC|nr:hypothetical protein LAZ67_3001238 [Cordylochernes scorpioides]
MLTSDLLEVILDAYMVLIMIITHMWPVQGHALTRNVVMGGRPIDGDTASDLPQRGEFKPTKVRLDKSKGKIILVVFFDYQGLVYYEFIKEGVTINKQAYKEILWKLLHDNDPAHRAIIVQDYLAKHSVSVLPHPPYSHDIAPCDVFFYPKLERTLKGKRFSSSSEVIENATVELNKLRKIDFELEFQQLFSRWKKMCR